MQKNKINTSDPAENEERFVLKNELQNLYNSQMISKEQLLGVQFFLNDNSLFCFKNYINISSNQIYKTQWYKEARKNPDYIQISIEDYSDFFASAKTNVDKIILFSIAPEKYDKDNTIDAVRNNFV